MNCRLESRRLTCYTYQVFGSLDPEKLLFVLVIAAIVMGPDKLPKIARQIAALMSRWQDIREKSVGELRSGFKELTDLELPHYRSGSIKSLLFEDNFFKPPSSDNARAKQPDDPTATSSENAPTGDTSIASLHALESTGENEAVENSSVDTFEAVYLPDMGSGFYEPSQN